MSGHSSFTIWIDEKAKYVLNKKNKKCKIKKVFFTSSYIPNSDELNIKTNKGVLLYEDINWDDLFDRYNKK